MNTLETINAAKEIISDKTVDLSVRKKMHCAAKLIINAKPEERPILKTRLKKLIDAYNNLVVDEIATIDLPNPEMNNYHLSPLSLIVMVSILISIVFFVSNTRIESKVLNLPNPIETYISHQVSNIDSKWASYTVKSYDNPASILYKVRLINSIETLLLDNRIKLVLKNLKRGNIVRSRFVNGKLAELLLATSYKKAYIIKPSNYGFEDIWERKWVDNPFEIRQARSSFVIRNGLFFDGKKTGVSGDIIRQVIKVFDWSIDFSYDIRVGDRVTIVYEEVFHNSDKVGTNNLLAAEFINKNRQFRAVRFTREDGRSDFFTPEGKKMKPEEKKGDIPLTPIEFTNFRTKVIGLVLQLNVLHRFATSDVNINSTQQ